MRLRGALVGIDDEDDSTFTITVDNKTFHFQAKDSEEREKWIRALGNKSFSYICYKCFIFQTLHSLICLFKCRGYHCKTQHSHKKSSGQTGWCCQNGGF